MRLRLDLKSLAMAGALLAAGLLSIFAALDSYAALGHRPSRSFGGSWAPNVTALRAMRADVEGDRQAARRFAEAAARMAPLDPLPLRILGDMTLRRGNPAAAESFFLAAAQLGWREHGTQRYWFDRAIEAGDHDVAAQRLEALLRVDPQSSANLSLLSKLESTAHGRREIARRLQVDASWAKLSKLDDLSGEQRANRFRLLQLIAQARIPLPSREIASISSQAFETGHPQVARHLWMEFAGAASPHPWVADGGFDAVPDEVASPFQWKILDAPGVAASVEAGPQALNTAIKVTSQTAAAAPVLRQWLVLPPGSHRLSWRQVGIGASFRPSLACKRGGSLSGRRGSASGPIHLYFFDVPSGACSAQNLTFSVVPESPSGAELWIDEVHVRRGA